MPVEPILVLIVVAVVANLIVMAALVVMPVMERRRSTGSEPGATRVDPAVAAAAVGGRTKDDLPGPDEGSGTYDRVVRIVSWTLILTTAVIVAVSGLWPDDQAAILVLLALAGIFVLIVHDLLPEDTLGPAKFIVEGSVAITAATLLVALTDGVESPFFFVYPLIVGGAALVVPPRVTLGLLAIAAGGYVLAVAVGSPAARLSDPAVAATVGINLTAVKVTAMTIGGFIAGLGGSIYAHYTTHIEHANFNVLLATFAIAYPILGGLRSVFGTILAVIFVQGFLVEGLRFMGDWRNLLFGALIVAAMNLRPHGLIDAATQKVMEHRTPYLVFRKCRRHQGTAEGMTERLGQRMPEEHGSRLRERNHEDAPLASVSGDLFLAADVGPSLDAQQPELMCGGLIGGLVTVAFAAELFQVRAAASSPSYSTSTPTAGGRSAARLCR